MFISQKVSVPSIWPTQANPFKDEELEKALLIPDAESTEGDEQKHISFMSV
jgi:hypothetical protein